VGLTVFATLVYTILQAEPRYSIPFRPFEILLAFTTLSAITTWSQRFRAPQSRPDDNWNAPSTTQTPIT